MAKAKSQRRRALVQRRPEAWTWQCFLAGSVGSDGLHFAAGCGRGGGGAGPPDRLAPGRRQQKASILCQVMDLAPVFGPLLRAFKIFMLSEKAPFKEGSLPHYQHSPTGLARLGEQILTAPAACPSLWRQEAARTSVYD